MPAPPYRFTSFDLNSCLEVAKTIHENGGLLSSAELAAHMGYKSDNNGSFNTRLANARLFGLISGSSSAIEATDRAREILHPDYTTTEARARLEAFESVPLYAAVLDQYHGQPLPDDTGLRNALTTRWGINSDKAPMVLSRLMDSAEQAGLFSTAGNRSRMIRPTISGRPVAEAQPTPPASTSDGARGPEDDLAQHHSVRTNKIIDGVLDILPNEKQWNEASLVHWLRFFEDALRLYYELPRSNAPSPNGARNVPAPMTDVEGGGR